MIRVLASLGQLYSLGWVNQFSPIHDLEGFMTWSFPESRCVLIGMVHLDPLPGSHQWNGDMQAILDSALRDAEILLEGGCDGLIVENMGDAPYLKGSVPPETVAAMTLATQKVVSLAAPVGIQVLAGANREALGIAAAVGAEFIRVEGFAYAHVAVHGRVVQRVRPRRVLGFQVGEQRRTRVLQQREAAVTRWLHGGYVTVT